MDLHFLWNYQNGVVRFRDFKDKKILLNWDLEIGRFAVKKL